VALALQGRYLLGSACLKYTLIFLKFSNHLKNSPFSNTFGKASLAVLGDLFPDDLIKMDLEQLVAFITQNGNNRLNDP